MPSVATEAPPGCSAAPRRVIGHGHVEWLRNPFSRWRRRRIIRSMFLAAFIDVLMAAVTVVLLVAVFLLFIVVLRRADREDKRERLTCEDEQHQRRD